MADPVSIALFVVSTAANAYLSSQQTIMGPRLAKERLKVTTSSYGEAIPDIVGTCGVAGVIVEGPEIDEKKKKSRGGKGGPTSITFSYTWTGIVMLGRTRSNMDLLRIWANGKIIFDKTAAQTKRKKKKKAVKFTFMRGEEDQLPRPSSVALNGDLAQAYRGYACVEFVDLPLDDYGGGLPNFKFELCASATEEQSALQATSMSPSGMDEYDVRYFAADWDRGRGYFVDVGSTTADRGIRVVDLDTMLEVRQSVADDIFGSAGITGGRGDGWNCISVGLDGYLYANAGGSANSEPLSKIDPDSLVEVASFGSTSSGTSNTDARFVTAEDLIFIRSIGPTGDTDFILVQSALGKIGLLHAADMAYVWGSGQGVTQARARACRGAIRDGSGEAWVLGRGTLAAPSATALEIYKMIVTVGAAEGVDDVGGNPFVSFESAGTIEPSDVLADWDVFEDAPSILYDEADDTVIILLSGGPTGGPYQPTAVKWSHTLGAIVWATAVTAIPANTNRVMNQSRLTDGTLVLAEDRTAIEVIDTVSGSLLRSSDWSGTLTNTLTGSACYDSGTDTVLVFVSGDEEPYRLLLGRASGAGEALDEVVSMFCADAGLGASDIDVTDLASDTVLGYSTEGLTTTRAKLEHLGYAFQFDCVESDFKLKFVKRGGASVATIGESDMMPVDAETDEVFRETRVQETELPRQVVIGFSDPARDYNSNAARSRRPTLPTPVMYSRAILSESTPVVMNETFAKQLAEVRKRTEWNERVLGEFRLPWAFFRLEPTDVVTVVLDDGTTYLNRLGQVDIGVDLTMEVQSRAETPTRVSTQTAGDSDGFPSQDIPDSGATRLFVLDVPLLRDADDTGGTSSLVHLMAAGYGQTGWPGAIVYRSAEGLSYSEQARVLSEAAWGTTANALADVSMPFVTDEENELRIYMATGSDELESCTQLEMLNGANAALVVNVLTGEPEIIGFRDVTPQDDGSFVLSGLLRGCRGTDVYTGVHRPGDLFILLNVSDVEIGACSLSDVGAARFWKGVGFGDAIEDVSPTVATHTGRDLKPYAPRLDGASESGGDITIELNRRTRVGGALRDDTDFVPLGEASEAYEVDVLDGPGGLVLRTLASTTTSVAYAAADVVTDFGSPPAEITLVPYQMSEAVGRGFAREQTVEVT